MSIYDKASLVLIPSGSKTSKVYSQKPTNGDGDFTFSRSTAATRVNASGNIEKETQNLLTYSNDFSNAIWVKNVTATGGQAGYDGSNDAWEISKGTASAYRYVRQSFSATSGVHTASVYAKAGTLNLIGLYIEGGSSPYISVDLSTGAITGQRGTEIDTQVTDVGNDWWRISLSFNENSSVFYIYPDWNQSNTGTLYIQDAQLEQGLVARDYIETTTTAIYGGITDNVPRLDYQGSCPALLLEPQRTNLLTQSEYLNDWAKTAVSVNSNVATSPEGYQNASEFVVTTQQTAQGIAKGFTADGTSDYIVSGYISKNSTAALVALKIRDYLGAGVTHCFVQFDPSTGDVQASIGEYSIESFNDDWWYVWSKPTTTIPSGARNAIIRIDNQSVGTNCIAYGIQVEAGSYATSYIPTYGSAVTRNMDATSKTGISSLIGQTEGTLFLDFEFINPNKVVVLFTIHDNANNKRLELWANNNVLYGFIGGSINIAIGNTTITNGRHKAAIAYDESGDQAFYVDGVQIGTSSTAYTIASLTSIGFDHWGGFGTYKTKEGVKQTLLFKTRLSNEELATLTTI